jgi:hypothetical protein
MRNGCTLAALISAMLNIINEVVGHNGDILHVWIGIILAIATLIAIWRIDVRNNNNNHGMA